MVYTKNLIWHKIVQNDYNPTEFILNDGTTAIVSIIYFGDETPTLETIDKFTIKFQGLPYIHRNNISAVAYELNNIFNIRRQSINDKENLYRYYEYNERYGWTPKSIRIYTRAHKKIYGFDPKGNRPGVPNSPWDLMQLK